MNWSKTLLCGTPDALQTLRVFARPALLAVVIALGPLETRAAEVSSIPRDDFWVPDGPVHSVLATNGLLYIGGQFDYVGPTAGTGGAHDLFSAAALPDFPKTDGAIATAIPDNQGGWFVGGQFNTLGGFSIANLGHIRADRTVDTNWAPNPDGPVLVMTFGPLGLYVGGAFSRISGQARLSLAALDPTDGAALAWRADATNAFGNPGVNALAMSGDTLYVGGTFAFIDGVGRWLLGAVHASSGQVLPWFPNDFNTQGANSVDAIVVADGIVYVGGSFTLITRPDATIVARNYLAAFDADSAAVTPWNPNANGPVSALALTCDAIFVAGSFTQIGGVPRNYLASLDLPTGSVRDWNPNANAPVKSLVLSGIIAYVGGRFTQIGGQPRDYVAALDLETGLPRTWSPKGDFDVSALALTGNSVFAGGRFSAGGEQRRNVAALDARTGRLAAWNPQADGIVRALAAMADTVYLGGEFTTIAGQTRNRLAAVNAVTGQPTAWNPNPSGIVRALAVAGNRVYVGGSITLTNVGGQARNRLAALDAVTGAATAWNPDANDEVDAFLVDGNTIYVGGRFIRMGGQVRRRLAAVDATTGVVRSWDPAATDQVNALAAFGNTVLAAGFFNSVGGQARTNLVAIDAATGTVTAWNPNPHFDIPVGDILRPSSLNALVAVGSSVYIGGSFDHVDTEPRRYLAAVSGNIPGAALPWRPEVDSFVNALAVPGDRVFAGGNFKNVSGRYRPHLAAFPLEGSPRIVRHPTSQNTDIGALVSFEVLATGQAPLAYQWQLNGTNLAGATGPTFTIASAQVKDSGEYTVVVTNDLGLINSRPATLIVLQPLIIVTQPQSQTVAPGSTVTLSVVASGNPPPIFQWRLNGVNIPGAIYPTFTIPNAQPAQGGSYEVVVANLGGAINSSIATVLITSPALGFADNLSARATITAASGVGSGSNVGATRDPAGEPFHVGFRGGRSVWLGWRAPGTGIATFNTRGSGFDTLLAVYTNPNSLTNITADEDRAGFYTSQVTFNAVANTEYLLAVDGFSAASGNIVLSWNLDTNTVPFPRIVTQPQGQVVRQGANATFSVDVVSPTPTNFQWFFECAAIPGATGPSLTITNVQTANLGNYRVVVMNASSRTAESFEAALEIGPVPGALALDKVEEPLIPPPARARGHEDFHPAAAPGVISVSVGSIDAQLFSNAGAGTSLSEPSHCGVLGGASPILTFHAVHNAVLVMDTIGSQIDTVLAAYHPALFLDLPANLVACDNNGAPDGIRSKMRFPTIAGRDYWVFVDGVNAARGPISLNWKMGQLPARGSNPPTNYIVRQGSSLMLQAPISGPFPPHHFQWLHNGLVIVSGTNATLVIAHLTATHGGTYSVITSNDFGSTTHIIAVVTLEIPFLTFEPQFSNSTLRLWWQEPPGRTSVLDSSSDLRQWTALLTNVATSQPIFRDYPATNPQRRFFRARPWP